MLTLGTVCSLHCNGAHIPEDVAAVGFDNIGAGHNTPTLTTISPDNTIIAQLAVNHRESPHRTPGEPRRQRARRTMGTTRTGHPRKHRRSHSHSRGESTHPTIRPWKYRGRLT
ncbi:hypothetical protein [Actinocrinis sp.]|uniref:hypothetical protein n=1 Tax=Actinocrinis sp. TaxID=1920516 RepID=UPI0039C8983E